MNNIALTFKTTWGWEFVQFVTLKDGRQLAIKGQTGAGYGTFMTRFALYNPSIDQYVSYLLYNRKTKT